MTATALLSAQTATGVVVDLDVLRYPEMPTTPTMGANPMIEPLLLARGPGAVRRPIVSIGVDAVKREAVGSLAHVGQEGCEVFPSRINADPPTTISGPILTGRVEASSAHGGPRH